jgi:hypothetical protein
MCLECRCSKELPAERPTRSCPLFCAVCQEQLERRGPHEWQRDFILTGLRKLSFKIVKYRWVAVGEVLAWQINSTHLDALRVLNGRQSKKSAEHLNSPHRKAQGLSEVSSSQHQTHPWRICACRTLKRYMLFWNWNVLPRSKTLCSGRWTHVNAIIYSCGSRAVRKLFPYYSWTKWLSATTHNFETACWIRTYWLMGPGGLWTTNAKFILMSIPELSNTMCDPPIKRHTFWKTLYIFCGGEKVIWFWCFWPGGSGAENIHILYI